MLHSNPGDYAWGQGGLDTVITQVHTLFSPQLLSSAWPPSLSKLLEVTVILLDDVCAAVRTV